MTKRRLRPSIKYACTMHLIISCVVMCGVTVPELWMIIPVMVNIVALYLLGKFEWNRA